MKALADVISATCTSCGQDQYIIANPHDTCKMHAGEATLLAVLEHRGLLDAAVGEQLAQVCAGRSRRPSR